MLLAGTGQVSDKGTKNFLIVDNSAWAEGSRGRPARGLRTNRADQAPETSSSTVEGVFKEFIERPDIAIVLINQHVRPRAGDAPADRRQVADMIRPLVEGYQQAFPALLEIPSKEHPYGAASGARRVGSSATDPSKDSVLKRSARRIPGPELTCAEYGSCRASDLSRPAPAPCTFVRGSINV